jgi:uncharacterized protein (DUF302 family)
VNYLEQDHGQQAFGGAAQSSFAATRREFLDQASTALLGLGVGLGMSAGAGAAASAEKSSALLATTKRTIAQTVVTTRLAHNELVAAFERELGRWDSSAGALLVKRKAPWSEVEREVARMAGPRGLMVIESIDQGQVTSLSGSSNRCALYLVGNPVIANSILTVDPKGGLYVPFRVALYQNAGAKGGSVVYDRPSSFLAQLDHPELTEIGAQLDDKIDAVARFLAALPSS